MLRLLIGCLAMLALPAQAQTSAEFPKNATVIIQLTGSQMASGSGQDLVPPLLKALRRVGLRYDGGPEVDYAASVEPEMDVGRWVEGADGKVWIYRRSFTVGLTPADQDLEPGGVLSPHFSVTAVLDTPNPDRVDEWNCLITLATRELAARYRPKGHVVVDGARCARR